jgi:hypothetical protein
MPKKIGARGEPNLSSLSPQTTETMAGDSCQCMCQSGGCQCMCQQVELQLSPSSPRVTETIIDEYCLCQCLCMCLCQCMKEVDQAELSDPAGKVVYEQEG